MFTHPQFILHKHDVELQLYMGELTGVACVSSRNATGDMRGRFLVLTHTTLSNCGYCTGELMTPIRTAMHTVFSRRVGVLQASGAWLCSHAHLQIYLAMYGIGPWPSWWMSSKGQRLVKIYPPLGGVVHFRFLCEHLQKSNAQNRVWSV